MKKLLIVSALVGGLFLGSLPAHAHCDTVDGPIAKVAIKALETGNVNAVLPYAPATAEAEIKAAFEQARQVRVKDAEAQRLADRFFLETVVRLHREGENAPYTGLKPAGMDFGPVIPAAEKTLEGGNAEALVELLTNAVRRHVEKRLQDSLQARSLPREPVNHTDVAAARARVESELGFVLYAEGLHQAIMGQLHHAEGGHSD